jgi:hypothetical protein
MPKKAFITIYFLQSGKRKELKKEHPDWNSSQIMKQVSLLWQRMP